MSKSKPFSVHNRKLDLEYAPPSFTHDDKPIVPINVTSLDIHYDVDVPKERVMGTARIKFSMAESGCPFLDMVPEPSWVAIDGKEVDPSLFALVRPAESVGYVRYLNEELNVKGGHVLEVEYPISGPTLLFTNGGARLGLFLNDLAQRSFLERYAPANLEYDQSLMRMSIKVSGARSDHRIFSNGSVSEISSNTWRIDFPDYFNCSSSYVHLTNRLVAEANGVFPGEEGDVPVTVYGNDAYLVNSQLSRALQVMHELESAYGPYAHQAMLIYIAETGEAGLAGMEYSGATITSTRVLAHEIAHSWFGRGIMPANGNAGWIDEAIATWRDYSYVRAYGPPNRGAVNLAGYSNYRRDTTRLAYKFGMLLMSELDFMLHDRGGLRPVLKSLYLAKRRELIDTPFFQKFLEEETGLDLAQIFARYVYGGVPAGESIAGFDASTADQEPAFSLADFARAHNLDVPETPHSHRPYTPEELYKLL